MKVDGVTWRLKRAKDQKISRLGDDNVNNKLHLAARLGPTKSFEFSGAAYQMQQELLWFKLLILKAVGMVAVVVSMGCRQASGSPVISPSLRFEFIDTIGTSSCVLCNASRRIEEMTISRTRASEPMAEDNSHVATVKLGEDCAVFDDMFECCQIYAGATIGKVLYIDIDVHHGDGVKEAFYFTDIKVLRIPLVSSLVAKENQLKILYVISDNKAINLVIDLLYRC
ncbi:histone deacetylase 9 isoform X3 [Tanacetum coccineum]